MYLSKEQRIQVHKWETIIRSTYNLSLMCTRLSVSILLYRISPGERLWNVIIFSIIGFIAVTNISATILLLISCHPIQKIWLPYIPGKCWPDKTVHIVTYYCSGRLLYLMIVPISWSRRRYWGSIWFDSCCYTCRLLMECQIDYWGQDRNLRAYGIGYIVRAGEYKLIAGLIKQIEQQYAQ